MLLRHEQGERETMQDAFGGAAPIAEIVTHIEEFAGKWHIIWSQVQVLAQLRSQIQLGDRQVVGAAAQALQLGASLCAVAG